MTCNTVTLKNHKNLLLLPIKQLLIYAVKDNGLTSTHGTVLTVSTWELPAPRSPRTSCAEHFCCACGGILAG